MLLLAIICPPLYFICVKKWGMFLITSVMALVALALLLLIVPPLILWGVAALMAIYHWKQKKISLLMDRHAAQVGRAVAASMSAGKP